MDEADQIAPGSLAAWRRWLEEHHTDPSGVWVEVPERNAAGDDALSYENAVCEALCWGWIDGQSRAGGADTGSALWFSPRRRGSVWAASNRARVERLEAEGRLQPPGRAAVEAARADGSWSVLIGPEQGVEPDALREGLDADPAARAFWDALPPSARLYALTQVAIAKREETRRARVEKLLAQCRAGVRPDR